jgi:hypothetical protein
MYARGGVHVQYILSPPLFILSASAVRSMTSRCLLLSSCTGGALGEPVDTALLVFSEKGAASSFVDTDPYIKAVRYTRFRSFITHTL